MKEFAETIWAGFRTLVVIGLPWFLVGYLLQNYVMIPWAIAYSVFPVIYFGIMPCFDGVLKLAIVVAIVGGAWYGSSYFLQNVLVFHWILAQAFLLVVLIAFGLLAVIIFPVKDDRGEGEDGEGGL